MPILLYHMSYSSQPWNAHTAISVRGLSTYTEVPIGARTDRMRVLITP